MWRSSKKANPTPTLVFFRPRGRLQEKPSQIKKQFSQIQELNQVRYCQSLMSPESQYPKKILVKKYLDPLLTYGLLLYWVPPTQISANTAPVYLNFFALNWNSPRSKTAQFQRNTKTGSARKQFKSKTRFSKIHFFQEFLYFLLYI